MSNLDFKLIMEECIMIPVVRFRKNTPVFSSENKSGSFNAYNAPVFKPRVNVSESESLFLIEIAAPGLLKDKFKLDVDKDVLTVSYDQDSNSDENKNEYIRREFIYGKFSKAFGVPESVDQDEISASYKDGILKIELLKKEEAKPKPAQVVEVV